MALYGRSVMAQEKEEQYYATIYEIENGNDPQGAYNAALEMFWDRIDPYLAMSKRLWNDGDFDACREYIERNLGNIAEFQTVPDAAGSFGDIYFVLGNCYYDRQNYVAAMGNFEIAVQFAAENPVYFRDYAISLARVGEVEEAEKMLQKAQTLGLETDSLSLLSGEIAVAKREYGSAIAHFENAIAQTGDDYLRYRAYHASDEIYKALGQPERSAELLEGSLNRIPLNYVQEMTERLADAYIKNGDYDNAIVLFEQLLEGGVPQYHLLEGLAIMLQRMGEFDRAESVLAQMADLFPDDYRVPMRKAYLEAEIQSHVANEERDYTLTKQYFDYAYEMYIQNAKPGEADPEMRQLELIIEQLRANMWID